ncbi:MAG: sulfurtransferase TusA family protein [Candidatus Rokubacteria bacterium]|nr:sulfurtransferase TusA family protein [Candidatus Rokubacteria bacterium]
MGQQPGAPAGTVSRAPGVELDLRGEVCPYTFLKSKLALEAMAVGEALRVVVDNETSARDVPRSLGSRCGPGPRRVTPSTSRRSRARRRIHTAEKLVIPLARRPRALRAGRPKG